MVCVCVCVCVVAVVVGKTFFDTGIAPALACVLKLHGNHTCFNVRDIMSWHPLFSASLRAASSLVNLGGLALGKTLACIYKGINGANLVQQRKKSNAYSITHPLEGEPNRFELYVFLVVAGDPEAVKEKGIKLATDDKICVCTCTW